MKNTIVTFILFILLTIAIYNRFEEPTIPNFIIGIGFGICLGCLYLINRKD